MTKQHINSQIKPKTAAILLKEARELQGITLEEAANSTKIRRDHLQALELGDHSKFPSAVYIRGFLKNYAKYLNLDDEKVLAHYRREVGTIAPAAKTINSELTPKSKIERIRFDPQRLAIFGALALLLLLIVLYVGSQINALLQPPHLELTSPVNISADYDGEIFVAGNSFKLEGVAAPQSVIRLNSETIDLKPGNEFSTNEIPLGEKATVIITATNQYGRTSTIKLVVKKGSTGIASTDKMSIVVEVKDQAVPLLIRTDGVIQFNDRAYPGDVISLDSKSKLQIETDSPHLVKVTIGGEEFSFTARNQSWELIEGKVIQK